MRRTSTYANAIYDCIVNQHMTIRDCAEQLDVSKSKVHFDINKSVLDELSNRKRKKLLKELELHFNIKHIHGGESTKKKYESRRIETICFSA